MSRPYHAKSFWEIQPPSRKSFYHQGFFAVKRRVVFILGAKWIGPRKRVAEGLCGWRHRNSFPMTQSAQSHRQMRSIPRCPKAVFYVFVFDYIHDSATMHNLCPGIFHRIEIWRRHVPTVCACFLEGLPEVEVAVCHY